MIHLLVALRLATAATQAQAPGAPLSSAVELAEPQWIRYRVSPGERVVDVAARFGVEVEDLAEWNSLDPGQWRLRPGKKLRVLARRSPPDRVRHTYVVGADDTWQSIAIAHRIDSRKLRAYNWKRERIRAGDQLVIWQDVGQPQTIGQAADEPVIPPRVEPGASSVGRPQLGRIAHAVQLPESPLYSRARPNWSWGSSHALEQLVAAVGDFRRATGFSGDVVVGSISRRGGRSFPPHRSHQSGRDVDLRLPVRPGVGRQRPPRADEVDWPATWALIRSLIETDEVAVIFLERRLQRRLYEAARWSGESHDHLADLIEWADERRWSHAIVRHAKGHDGHIHVRFRCGPTERRCKG